MSVNIVYNMYIVLICIDEESEFLFSLYFWVTRIEIFDDLSDLSIFWSERSDDRGKIDSAL